MSTFTRVMDSTDALILCVVGVSVIAAVCLGIAFASYWSPSLVVGVVMAQALVVGIIHIQPTRVHERTSELEGLLEDSRRAIATLLATAAAGELALLLADGEAPMRNGFCLSEGFLMGLVASCLKLVTSRLRNREQSWRRMRPPTALVVRSFAAFAGECCICLEDLTEVGKGPELGARSAIHAAGPSGELLRMPCGHVMHYCCGTACLLRSLKCPVCRQPAPDLGTTQRVVLNSTAANPRDSPLAEDPGEGEGAGAAVVVNAFGPCPETVGSKHLETQLAEAWPVEQAVAGVDVEVRPRGLEP